MDFSVVEDELLKKLISLFSQMFSKEGIEKDAFIQSCISPDMTIPLSVLLNSPRVLDVTGNLDLILRALESSDCVSLVNDQVHIHPKIERNTIILRDLASHTTEESLLAFLSAHDCPAVLSCKCEMNSTWFVSFRSENDARASLLKIRGLLFEGVPVHVRLKTESLMKPLFKGDGRSVQSNPVQCVPLPSEGNFSTPHAFNGGSNESPMQYQNYYQNSQQSWFLYQQQNYPVQGMVYYGRGADGMMWPMVHGPYNIPPAQMFGLGSLSNPDDGRNNSNKYDGKKNRAPANSTSHLNQDMSKSVNRTKATSFRSQVRNENNSLSRATEKIERKNPKKPKKKEKGESSASPHPDSSRRGASTSSSTSATSEQKRRSRESSTMNQFNLDSDFPSLTQKNMASMKSSESPSNLNDNKNSRMSWANALSKTDVTSEIVNCVTAGKPEISVELSPAHNIASPNLLTSESDLLEMQSAIIGESIDKAEMVLHNISPPHSAQQDNSAFHINDLNTFPLCSILDNDVAECTTNKADSEERASAKEECDIVVGGKPTFLDVLKKNNSS